MVHTLCRSKAIGRSDADTRGWAVDRCSDLAWMIRLLASSTDWSGPAAAPTAQKCTSLSQQAVRIVRQKSVGYLLRGTRPSGASHKRYPTLNYRSLLSRGSRIQPQLSLKRLTAFCDMIPETLLSCFADPKLAAKSFSWATCRSRPEVGQPCHLSGLLHRRRRPFSCPL